MSRIENHPIVSRRVGRGVRFTFDGCGLEGIVGETIASALFAHGIRVFGHHPKDGSPQGIYCANGQCSQCLVLADGRPVKACMTPICEGMTVQPLDRLPILPRIGTQPQANETETVRVAVLILGGGPAGLSAAVELGARGVKTILVDDKDRLGGKLVLQTHKFFGSIDAVYAGTRGIDIGARLAREVHGTDTTEVWLNSTALAVFGDRRVGVLRGERYVLVEPEVLLVATGAREKSLVFQGNTLPGVFGAGAFQTLVNRDLVRAAERLFIVGGGNVGLIAGYHALQAGIDVVGLVEALPECGGYRVHRDKLARMGVPIYTSHTILSANGVDSVQSVTVAELGEGFRPIAGTERSFACDTVLVAVGLDPVDEFVHAADAIGMTVFSAGDAEEIAEASAAIFSGRIRGLEIARALGATNDKVPDDWRETAEILKSRPGRTIGQRSPHRSPDASPKVGRSPVFPVLHCSQEIPCNPCASVCPHGLIRIDAKDIRRIPQFVGNESDADCIGCERCVAVCPGLAITLIDGRDDPENPIVTVPFEFAAGRFDTGSEATALDVAGNVLGNLPIEAIKDLPGNDHTVLLKLRAPRTIAPRIAGVRVQPDSVGVTLPDIVRPLRDADMVCRCERVTAGEIRALIRSGYRDLNEIKAVTRAGMGACGGKTCQTLILRLFREEGISLDTVTRNVPRPLFVEVPLGAFGGFDAGTSEPSARPTQDGDGHG